ncbi:MAG: GntR family transcriptional regulator [Betaproteobacteria bacterium]
MTERARILATLRQSILDVTLAPGAAIAESDLAAHFRVSRTPVREALLRLADEGLVDIRPQRGTYVAPLSLKRIEEALFVREAVEGAVLERIVTGGEGATVAKSLAAIVDAQEAAIARRDVAGALDADTRFHHALVDASGLPGVWRVVAQARDLHHRIRAIAVPELGSASQAIRDHRAIARALRDGDATRAAKVMKAHLARNLALARAIARRHPDYFGTDGVAARVDATARTARGTSR